MLRSCLGGRLRQRGLSWRRYFSKEATIIRRCEYEKQPWANGEGFTYEIARGLWDPERKKLAPFSWRVSIADLKAPGGPWSTFTNVDRHVVLLEGDCQLSTMDPIYEDELIDLEVFKPFTFRGDMETSCKVVAPEGRDLNLMIDRADFTGGIKFMTTEELIFQPPSASVHLFVVAVDGGAEIEVRDGGESSFYTLDHEDTLRYDISKFLPLVDVISGKACICCIWPKFEHKIRFPVYPLEWIESEKQHHIDAILRKRNETTSTENARPKGTGVTQGPNSRKKASKKRDNKVQPDPDQNVFTQVDIRVGKITKAWEHPGSDKLFCEEIDVGEANPRKIASGLRAHYKTEDLENRLVLVVCNLKAAKLAGFKSEGMVLCAIDSDSGKTEFVEPPVGSKVGESVKIDGLIGTPVSSNQMKKKKIWSKVETGLKSNGDRIACWEGKPITTSAGKCSTASVANGQIL